MAYAATGLVLKSFANMDCIEFILMYSLITKVRLSCINVVDFLLEEGEFREHLNKRKIYES